MTPRILINDEAKKIIDQLREKNGPLMFHQSGGCCDGSAPMCFAVGEFFINDTDVLLGTVHGCEFYMSKDQFNYWQHTQLTLGITEGRGASFSLEIPMGIRFIIKSRLFSEAESRDLEPIKFGEG